MQIEISGILIDIRKKKIKNLHLTVVPPNGTVRVSSPLHLSDESIAMFVRTKIGWIKKQKEKFENQPRQSEREYVSGETLYLFGKQYFLKVEYSHKGNSLVLSGNDAILTVRKESAAKQREAFVNEWYRALLKEKIEYFLPIWEQRTNLYCDSWHTKYMTTCWGTCNTRSKRIWLNLQLAKKPAECLEYVILHELIHLKINNHGNEFVALMDKYMPDWRDVRKLLNNLKLDYLSNDSIASNRE